MSLVNSAEVEERGILDSIDFAERHWASLVAAARSGEALPPASGDAATDARLLRAFRSEFQALDVAHVTARELSGSEVAKRRWREFLPALEGSTNGHIFHMLTLLRCESRLGYTPANTILVPRAQFLCIEAARTALGLNAVALDDSMAAELTAARLELCRVISAAKRRGGGDSDDAARVKGLVAILAEPTQWSLSDAVLRASKIVPVARAIADGSSGSPFPATSLIALRARFALAQWDASAQLRTHLAASAAQATTLRERAAARAALGLRLLTQQEQEEAQAQAQAQISSPRRRAPDATVRREAHERMTAVRALARRAGVPIATTAAARKPRKSKPRAASAAAPAAAAPTAAAAPPLPVPRRDARLDALVRFARSRGARFGGVFNDANSDDPNACTIAMVDGAFGRGLGTTVPLRKGDVVVAIPRRLMISSESVRQSGVGWLVTTAWRVLKPYHDLHIDHIALFLYEHVEGSGSPIEGFLKALPGPCPHGYDDCLVTWSEAELAQLAHLELIAEAKSEQVRLRAAHNAFLAAVDAFIAGDGDAGGAATSWSERYSEWTEWPPAQLKLLAEAEEEEEGEASAPMPMPVAAGTDADPDADADAGVDADAAAALQPPAVAAAAAAAAATATSGKYDEECAWDSDDSYYSESSEYEEEEEEEEVPPPLPHLETLRRLRDVDLATFTWAYNSVQTRSFILPKAVQGATPSFLQGDPGAMKYNKDEGVALMPIIGLVNHATDSGDRRPNARVVWRSREEEEEEEKEDIVVDLEQEKKKKKKKLTTTRYFCIEATRPIAPGAEVLISYGARSGGDLLIKYGFFDAGDGDEVVFGLSKPRLSSSPSSSAASLATILAACSTTRPVYCACDQFWGQVEGYVFMSGGEGLGYYRDESSSDRVANAAASLQRRSGVNPELAELLLSRELIRIGSKNVGLRNPLLPHFRVYVANKTLLGNAFELFERPVSLENERAALIATTAWLREQIACLDTAVAALPQVQARGGGGGGGTEPPPTSRAVTAAAYRQQIRISLAIHLDAVLIAQRVVAVRERGNAAALALDGALRAVALSESFAATTSPESRAAVTGGVLRHAAAIAGALATL